MVRRSRPFNHDLDQKEKLINFSTFAYCVQKTPYSIPGGTIYPAQIFTDRAGIASVPGVGVDKIGTNSFYETLFPKLC